MPHLSEAELQAWLDRELDPGERTRVAGHLEACVECRRLAAGLRAVSEAFSAAMLRYDEDLGALPAALPEPVPAIRVRGSRLPAWAGRAAAIVLLLGAAAAAAMVPGSPLRSLLVSPDEPAAPVVVPEPADRPEAALPPGASITIRPVAGELTVRITGFPAGTPVRVGLSDAETAVASLPDGAENARFIVASGLLDVVGSGVAAVETGDGVTVRLPRSLRAGVVELDGEVVVRVTDGRLRTLRQVSRQGDEAVFEVGG